MRIVRGAALFGSTRGVIGKILQDQVPLTIERRAFFRNLLSARFTLQR